MISCSFFFFFFNDPPTPDTSPLPLPPPFPFLICRVHPPVSSLTCASENENRRFGSVPLSVDGGTSRSGFWRSRSRLRGRSEEHTSELQSHLNLVCRLLLEKKKKSISIEPAPVA